jgi:DNA-binding LacI/PurR family transcriptional regulator
LNLKTQKNKSKCYAAELRGKIRARLVAPGMPLESIRKAAARLGVSDAVVRYAYEILEEEGLIERRGKTGTYVRETEAAIPIRNFAVATGYSPTGFENYFDSLTLAASEEQVLITPFNLHYSDWQKEIQLLLSRKPEALFVDVMSTPVKLEELQALTIGTPVCFVNRWEWDAPLPERAVLIDYQSAIMRALRLFLDKGHRRILLLGNTPVPMPCWKKRFEIAGARVGLKFNSDELPYLAVETLSAQDFSQFDMLYSDPGNMPTAVLAFNDYFAVRFLDLLKTRHGITGLEVIGFYNTIHSQQPGQEFSSFAINYEHMWRKAIRMFTNPEEAEANILMEIPKLIVR